MITEDRKKELIEEANSIYGSMGWNIGNGFNAEENKFFWDYVYNHLGYDSCPNCGYYNDLTTFDENGFCDSCSEEDYVNE